MLVALVAQGSRVGLELVVGCGVEVGFAGEVENVVGLIATSDGKGLVQGVWLTQPKVGMIDDG